MYDMSFRKTRLALAVAAGLALARFAYAQDVQPAPTDALEQYAFSIGLQAYLYGYPLVITEISRREMLVDPAIKINRFHHFTQLITPAVKSAVSANVDTMMSIAWLDFSGGPLLLHLPDMHGRYYVVQFNDFYTNSFAYVGLRTTGTREQRYLVVGPDWRGSAPPGSKVTRCPTNVVFVVGRILVDGANDVQNVRALQDEMSLTPLRPSEELIETPDATNDATLTPPAIVEKMDATNYFATLATLKQRYPPPRQDRAMVSQFEWIGVNLDSEFDASRLNEATRRGLARAANSAVPFLVAIGPKIGGTTVNGWWTPSHAGDFGTDYVARAYMARDFIWPNVAEEAVYPMTSVDGAGRPLDGEHRYILHFAKGGTPPVDAFWSVTMFNSNRGLVENPIHRYSIGSRTQDLKFNSDGSLDLFIQSELPQGHVANWLPAPVGPFLLTMRLYLPRPEILNGTYTIPAVECANC
jgi:hypothetical protein